MSETHILWIRASFARSQPAGLKPAAGLVIETAEALAPALEKLRLGRAAMVLADFPLPDCTPAELVEQVKRARPQAHCVLRYPAGTMADALHLARLGADDFLPPEMDGETLFGELEAAARRLCLRNRLDFDAAPEPWKRFLVGESRAMREIDHVIRLVGPRRSTVLITGETGTGKEMVARAIHLGGPRSALPMVAVNCSALPENLLEAELFGHVKGAFTGAYNSRVGRFEQAHGSTLFLDEIGELPLELQAKLLRVLQEREFQRLGSSETLRVDVRVIAASNQDLAAMVEQGKFRQDLYYRLNVVPLEVPPLRQRLSDIPLLVHYFLEKICRLEQVPLKRFARETLDRLSTYSWPGNVRQLENAVEMAVAMSGDRNILYPADFRLPTCTPAKLEVASGAPLVTIPEGGLDFEQTVSRIERSILEQALRKTGGNKKMAADLLRLKRTTLAAKLRTLEAA